MLLYILIIALSGAFIATMNAFFYPGNEPWWFYPIATVVVIIALILLDGLVALIIRRMPEKWFSYKKKGILPSKGQLKLFETLGVKKWKDHVPELGGFTDFHKDHVENPFDDEYISKFILEAVYGIVIHYWSIPFSLLVLLMDYKMYGGGSYLWLTLCLPCAVVNMVLIGAPALILQYNLPKLVRIHEINIRRAEKAK